MHIPNSPNAKNLSSATIASPVAGPLISPLTTIVQNGRIMSNIPSAENRERQREREKEKERERETEGEEREREG